MASALKARKRARRRIRTLLNAYEVSEDSMERQALLRVAGREIELLQSRELGLVGTRVVEAQEVVARAKTAKVSAKPKAVTRAHRGARRCARCGAHKGSSAFKGGGDVCMKCSNAAGASTAASDDDDDFAVGERGGGKRTRASGLAYLRAHPELTFSGPGAKELWLKEWVAGNTA